MDDILNAEIENNDIEKYLTQGQQTQITPEVQNIASEIHGTTMEKVQNILNLGPNLVGVKDYDENTFNKRTGSQIIQDGYVMGCTDAALAFIVLSRGVGIPTKYIETIDVEWLKQGGKNIHGHVYVQVYDELQDKWVWVNPMKRSIDNQPGEDRVIFGEGLDSWDLGLRDQSSLEEKFDEFRKQWLLKTKI